MKILEKLQTDPVNNLYKINREIARVEKNLKSSGLGESTRNRIEQYIEDLKSRITIWEDEAKKRFGLSLEEELKKVGFELRGHYPLLRASFYTLQVDLENFKVIIWYGPQQEKLDVSLLSPAEVTKKLEKIHRTITERPFDSEDFLSKIYEAYKM
ncbi:MAG: hypothetical protein ACPL09_05980, partial [Candidatus Methanodesulfokora sp.]